jgi:hypothetical protein
VAPHRDKLEAPLGQFVVPQSLLSTSRTLRPSVTAGPQFHFDRRLFGVFNTADLATHKRLEFFDQIKGSLVLHPVLFALINGCVVTPFSQSGGQGELPTTSSNNVIVDVTLIGFKPQIFLKRQKKYGQKSKQ